jgi:hypothetical protein
MFLIDAQMPFRVRFESVHANEFILLLGGRLVLAPRVPFVPHDLSLTDQFLSELKSLSIQLHRHSAPHKSGRSSVRDLNGRLRAYALWMISAAKRAARLDLPSGSFSRKDYVKALRNSQAGVRHARFDDGKPWTDEPVKNGARQYVSTDPAEGIRTLPACA